MSEKKFINKCYAELTRYERRQVREWFQMTHKHFFVVMDEAEKLLSRIALVLNTGGVALTIKYI